MGNVRSTGRVVTNATVTGTAAGDGAERLPGTSREQPDSSTATNANAHNVKTHFIGKA
jgi:hypothetical protein